MTQQYEAFEKRKMLYFITGLIVSFIVGLGYTWSIVQTPFVQALGGESVTATVALCYTITILCSTMSPTVLGGFTRHLSPKQMVLIGGLLFGIGYLTCGHVTTVPMLFLTYGLGTGIGAGLIYPTMMGYSASVLPENQGIASGLMAGVYGGAAIIWSPILANLIEKQGITTTFHVIGIICLVVLIAAAFIIKPIPEGYVEYKKNQAKQSAKNQSAAPKPSVPDLTRGQMVKTSMFYVAAIALLSVLPPA
ncbi:MAG: MFS transporter [Lachnospiraceae bacterium]|nr:MFS transporter [Lachnospiraceae bacterium]